MMLQLIIFDCDGVLVDSETLTHNVLVELVAGLGGSAKLLHELNRFKSAALSDTFPFIEQQLGRKLPADFEQQYREGTYAAFKAHLQPIPGIEKVVTNLTMPFCVASNGPVSKIRLNLGLTGLLSFFEEKIFSCYDIKRWKPEPDIYLYAAHEMGVPPKSCVVIEDSVVGIRAAQAAGMRVLGYAAADNAAALRLTGAQLFQEMKQLPKILQALQEAKDE